MSRLRSSKLWQALSGKARLQEQVAAREPARSRVPKLPVEILEMIFIRLDFWTLLRCRTVCHLWHNCIPGTSPALRSTLFLSSLQTDRYLSHLSSPEEVQPPPYLRYFVTFANNFLDTRAPQPATEYSVRALDKTQEDAHATPSRNYNRMLFSPMTQSKLRKYKRTWITTTTTNTVENGTRPPPLWMSMYATSPPSHALRMRFEFGGTRLVCDEAWVQQHNISDIEVWDSEGVTVGRVLNGICDAIWWPDMILAGAKGSDGRDFSDVRLIAREEGEVLFEEEGEGVGVVVKEEVRLKNHFFPRFAWEK